MKWLAALCILFPFTAMASPNPCRFGGEDEAHYHIREAYKAADLVVAGKPSGKAANGSDLRFEVLHTYKGHADKEITLVGQRAVTTEWIGFALQEGKEFLLLLKPSPNGPYMATEEFNSSCPTFYFIEDGKVAFTETVKVPLADLENYLSQATDFTYKLP